MKATVADAAGRDTLPSGAACDTDAPIKIRTVTRGTFRRAHPIIGLPIRRGHNVRFREISNVLPDTPKNHRAC